MAVGGKVFTDKASLGASVARLEAITLLAWSQLCGPGCITRHWRHLGTGKLSTFCLRRLHDSQAWAVRMRLSSGTLGRVMMCSWRDERKRARQGQSRHGPTARGRGASERAGARTAKSAGVGSEPNARHEGVRSASTAARRMYGSRSRERGNADGLCRWSWRPLPSTPRAPRAPRASEWRQISSSSSSRWTMMHTETCGTEQRGRRRPPRACAETEEERDRQLTFCWTTIAKERRHHEKRMKKAVDQNGKHLPAQACLLLPGQDLPARPARPAYLEH